MEKRSLHAAASASVTCTNGWGRWSPADKSSRFFTPVRLEWEGRLRIYNLRDDTYALPPEHSAFLTRTAAPANLARVYAVHSSTRRRPRRSRSEEITPSGDFDPHLEQYKVISARISSHSRSSQQEPSPGFESARGELRVSWSWFSFSRTSTESAGN